MIFTERTIKMSNDVCEIDNPIVLYRGDYNVEIRFTIIECPYKYSAKNSTNIIEEVDASYGQLVIKVPNDGSPIFSDVVETKKGSVVFALSKEMIDESIEVGNYTFQIRLFDANKESRATIPPIENGILIREPIASEDITNTNEVGVATVGYALTTAGTSEDAFDSEGNYNKTTWATGDRITSDKLNKIEAGIDGVNKKVASSGEVDLSSYAKKTDLPTRTSQLTNDSGFITSVPSEYITETELNNKGYATTSQIPTVPTKVSEFTNDANYASETYVTNKIAEAQLGGEEVDLSGYAKTSDIPTKTSQLTNDSNYTTKKYVDDTISGKADKSELHNHTNKAILDSITQDKINQWNNGGSSEANSTIPKLSTICVKDSSGNSTPILDFDLIPKDKSTVYLNDVFTEAQGDTTLKVRRNGIDSVLGTLTTDYMLVTVSYKTSDNKLFVANTRNAIEFDFNTNRKKNNNLSSLSGKPDKTDVLTRDNTILYTPTQNYHPATKKYVDDAVAGVSGGTGFSGDYNDLINKPTIPNPYVLPTASATVLGGVKVGDGLSISNGVLSATGGAGGSSINDTTASTTTTYSSNKIENIKENLTSQIEEIENYSLIKHTDGLLYIKKQDGTLIGTGVEVGNDVDLSTLSMTITGQTLTLKDGNTTLSTATIPTAKVTDEQLTAIIQAKIDDGTITNMTIPDDSITTKKLNIAPKVVNGITNPDFSNGTTGYTLYAATSTSNDDGIEVIPTGENGSIVQSNRKYTKGHIIYGSALVKTSSPNVALFPYNSIIFTRVYHSGSGEFERLSVLFSAQNYNFNPGVVNASTDSLSFIVKSFTFIDLTDAFGSGNEPDKEYMDEFLNGFNNAVIVDDGLQILGDTHIRNKRMDKMLPRITKIDDENIVYYGAWTKETNSNYDNNSSHYSSDENSYMEYTFMGTGINIYDSTGHNKGMVEIFIDGVSKGTIDRYTSGMKYKTLLYSIKNLNFDTHTIKIVVTRTKNNKSSNYTFTFDYLEVIDYFPLNNTVEENDSSIYKAKILNNLTEVVKDSKLALFKHTNAVTIDSAKPTIGDTTNPLKVNTYQGTKKALLKFDLSDLKGKKIKKAYLRLVCSNYNGNTILDTSFNINAILQPWDNTASWNNYRNSDAWNTAGASGNGTDINSDTVNVGNIYNVEEWTNGFFADITTIVSNWNNDVYENNGILISGDGANFVTNGFNGESPCLIVEYTDNLDDISMFTPAKKIQNAMNFLAQGHGTGKFNWQSSGALNAMANAYILFGDEYKHNLSTFFNYYINESGEFVNGATVDNMYKTAFGPALIKLYKATNEPKYLTALQSMRTMVDSQPKDSNGIYRISSSITELAYCGLPFLADYGDTFDDQTATDIAINQCILLYDAMISGQSDKVPLHQVNVAVSKGWSRGMGWLFAGIAKVLISDKIKQHSRYNELVTRFIELANTLRRYQRPSGAWCSLIHDSSTFEESSGTILFGTAISIGLNEGILDESFNETLSKIIDVICKEHTKTGTDMQNVFMYRRNSYRSPEKNVSNIGWGLFAEMITVIAKNNI